jgi:hypothetical protein
MGNTPHLDGTAGPRGDMGIGLCVACCNEHAGGDRKGLPEFAVTMAPIPLPSGQVIVLPTCYPHLKAQVEGASKPLLLAARGAR